MMICEQEKGNASDGTELGVSVPKSTKFVGSAGLVILCAVGNDGKCLRDGLFMFNGPIWTYRNRFSKAFRIHHHIGQKKIRKEKTAGIISPKGH
jgi:hypothetical protein